MSVLNYPNHMVYEIWTNHGYLTICQNKTTNLVEWSQYNSSKASPTATQRKTDADIV